MTGCKTEEKAYADKQNILCREDTAARDDAMQGLLQMLANINTEQKTVFPELSQSIGCTVGATLKFHSPSCQQVLRLRDS